MKSKAPNETKSREGALIVTIERGTSPASVSAQSSDQDGRRGALLDLAVWAGIPINEVGTHGSTLRRIFAAVDRPLDRLSTRGLVLLAELQGVRGASSIARRDLCRAVRRAQGWRGMLRRHRRVLAGSVLSRLIHGEQADTSGDGRTVENRERLRGRVAREGVVAGLTSELRGVADDYIAQKLDEIERRIDSKLDEIEARVNEWRAREIAARKRALLIGLAVVTVVTLLLVGYDYIRGESVGPGSARETAKRVDTRVMD